MTDERFRQLVSNWVDGSLSESESELLQAELETSTRRRNEFADICELDADLRLMSDDTADFDSQIVLPPQAIGPRGGAILWIAAAAAIAAGILLAIGYGIGRDRNDPPGTLIADSNVISDATDEVIESGCAVLSRIIDAQFAGGVTYEEGDSLEPGNLKLISGAVQVDFFSGAIMLMDEATEVNLVSSWEAECVGGKVTMHVPPPAIGFRLILPGMKVVDLGTEFGVEVAGTESSLHVFEGEVEAYVPGSEMQVIREGESLLKSTDQAAVSGAAKPTEFPNALQFEARLEAFHKQRTKEWWDSLTQVRSDDRILGCFLFKQWQEDRWKRLVNNFTIPKHRSRHGSAVGTRWVEGRWPTKDALEFNSPSDRVRMNLGKEMYDGLTLSAWIRVDRLRKYNALMLSDGYEDGEPHWQIDSSGRLMFSVSYWKSPEAEKQGSNGYRQNQIYYSPPVLTAGGRRWHHVAVTYDSTTGEAVQYIDGKEVSREHSEHHQDGRQVTFGPCSIGNWGVPLKGVPFPVRSLNGRVDEFLIHQAPLSGDEIANLYELGVPH